MREPSARPKVVVCLDRGFLSVIVRTASPWGDPDQHPGPPEGAAGTPQLLWKVENDRQSTECIGGAHEGGCYWTRVMCNGRARELAIFGTPGDAIRWALDRELELVAGGWRRVG